MQKVLKSCYISLTLGVKNWNMNQEKWLEVKGYEGLYQVSNLGSVKSLKRNKMTKDKLLVLSTSGGGYLNCNLQR